MYPVFVKTNLFLLLLHSLHFFHHHPELWARLLDLDKRARAQFGPGPLGQFKQNWSVARLEERFAREDGQTAPIQPNAPNDAT